MEFQSNRNQLIRLKNMGFRITWQLINIGLSDNDCFQKQITKEDLFDFIKIVIDEKSENYEEYISLLVYEDDEPVVYKKIEDFMQKEKSLYEIEIRKWRALKLYDLLSDIEKDEYAVISLYDFWLSYGISEKIGKVCLEKGNEFLSKEKEVAIEQSRRWLVEETKNIIADDSALSQ